MTARCVLHTLTNGIADELSFAEGATRANFGALDLLLTVLDAILYLASSSSCSSPHRQSVHAYQQCRTQTTCSVHCVYACRVSCYLSLQLLLLFVSLSFK
jgi:hypothetical protein